MESEAETVRRMRNATAYQGIKNTLISWTLSPEWSEIPKFMNVRGECVVKHLTTRGKVVKIVANGMVSGEIQCR